MRRKPPIQFQSPLLQLDPQGRVPRQSQRHLAPMILRITLSLLALGILLAAGLGGFWLKSIGVFNLNENRIGLLANYTYEDNSIVFDRENNKIGEFFDRYHVFVPFSDLPSHFVAALTAIEDGSFYSHPGVDLKAIVRAAIARIRTGRFAQGASTITQQLVRNTIILNEKTVERKILEIAWALEVEKHISKEKILEIYTNSMFLGNGSYGVGAAAHRYFGKNIKDISPAESALIAGLFQSPSRFNPTKYPQRAKKRQLKVIEAMRKKGLITQEEADAIASEPLVYQEYKYVNAQSAPWFVDHVRENLIKLKIREPSLGKQKGLRIHTTLDSKLQALAERSIRWYDPRLSEVESRTGRHLDTGSNAWKQSRVEASMLVTDPRNGDILAMVGGRDYRKSQFNRTTSAMRSPGSAFKPIVYTQALLQGFKWSDMIYVSPINIENYRPKNMEDDYLTETTMMRAFYRSMNSPTIEIATKVGLTPIIELAKSMGIQSPIKHEYGSAIGSSDVTMMDLARMYGTYATGGDLTEIGPITKITNADGELLWERAPIATRKTRVLNSKISYLMTQGMRAVLTSGTAHKSAALAQYAAGKTGTSNENSDNWFCGYTPDLVSIVWAGTDENTPIMANVSGSALALPIWDQFITNSFAVRAPKSFDRPEGITEATIHPLYGHRVNGGARMFFLSTNEPMETSSALESIENKSTGTYRNVFRH